MNLMGPISKDRKIKKALANAKASLAIEGLEVPDDILKVIEKYAKGELTEKEVVEIIKKAPKSP